MRRPVGHLAAAAATHGASSRSSSSRWLQLAGSVQQRAANASKRAFHVTVPPASGGNNAN